VQIARGAVALGTAAIAATPHVTPEFPTTPEQMERGVADLRRWCEREAIDIQILHGAEIDLGILFQLAADDIARFSLAQNARYVLLEFPYRAWPHVLPGSVDVLKRLGMIPVLAHPERNPEVQDRPARLREAVNRGALVQITAGSLTGVLGKPAMQTAWNLLRLRLVHVVASDLHGPGAGRGALSSVAEVLDDKAMAYLTSEAPAAIVAGDAPPDPPRIVSPL
jgi:protein-tyrosine phosphatase